MSVQLHDRLASGATVVGSFVSVASGTFTEIVALSGFDFVIIDMEHAAVDAHTAEEMVRAADVVGVPALIRVTENAPPLILRALDAGAQGVHIPDVNDVHVARAAVRSCKYGPIGNRGLASVRAAKFGLQGRLSDYAAESNRNTVVVAHIESLESIRNLSALLAVPGIDVYYLGPVDLSNDLGVPGEVHDPRVVRLVEESIHQIVRAGKLAGCIVNDVTAARQYRELGARYFACHAARLMASASRKFVADILK